MVRDLVETAVRMVKQEKMETVKDKARELADQRIAEILYPLPTEQGPLNPFEAIFRGTTKHNIDDDESYQDKIRQAKVKQKHILEDIKNGRLIMK